MCIGFWPFDAFSGDEEGQRGGFGGGGDGVVGDDLHRYEDFEENGR